MRFAPFLAAAVCLAAAASPAAANEYADAIAAHAETVRAWLAADIIHATLKAQNDKHAGEHTRSLMMMVLPTSNRNPRSTTSACTARRYSAMNETGEDCARNRVSCGWCRLPFVSSFRTAWASSPSLHSATSPRVSRCLG